MWKNICGIFQSDIAERIRLWRLQLVGTGFQNSRNIFRRHENALGVVCDFPGNMRVYVESFLNFRCQTTYKNVARCRRPERFFIHARYGRSHVYQHCNNIDNSATHIQNTQVLNRRCERAVVSVPVCHVWWLQLAARVIVVITGHSVKIACPYPPFSLYSI